MCIMNIKPKTTSNTSNYTGSTYVKLYANDFNQKTEITLMTIFKCSCFNNFVA